MKQRRIKFRCCVLLTAACLLSLGTVGRAAARTEVNVTAHYAHPVTGVVDDPGNNPAIGQAMCEKVLFSTAVLEGQGATRTLTLRFTMTHILETIRVQRISLDGIPHDTKLELVSEDKEAHTQDLRFLFPPGGALLRIAVFVPPMERDVLFFASVAEPKPAAVTTHTASKATSTSTSTSNLTHLASTSLIQVSSTSEIQVSSTSAIQETQIVKRRKRGIVFIGGIALLLCAASLTRFLYHRKNR